MTDRENKLRAIRFEKPERIPMTFLISDACYNGYPEAFLYDEMEAHPLLFPGFVRPQEGQRREFRIFERQNEPFRDGFGCLWKTPQDGITGVVVEHPLSDLNRLDGFRWPDSEKNNGLIDVDWPQIRQLYAYLKKEGYLTIGGLRHGHTFLQLCDLCGYENLLMYFADEEPRLGELIEKLEAFNAEIIRRFIDIGVDVMEYPEDLGMQVGPMLSPGQFRKYIQPSYRRLMQLAREKNILIHMHSDGDLHLLLGDLIESGVEIMNLQDLVNGIDWIQENLKGKTCISLDVDRQNVTMRGTPAQVDALICEEVAKLNSPDGGLMMQYGLYPGIPRENVRAIMDAMERYCVV